MTDRPLRIAIWCAVSTPEQAKIEKDSLPAQERDGREWAEGMGGEVVRVYTVPGHSRKYIRLSEAMEAIGEVRELVQDCERHLFDVLWCRNRDRLGRTVALIATIDGVVSEVGAEVYSAAMPHPIGQSSGRASTLMPLLEGWMAQAENTERVERTRMGMTARIKRGMLPNHPPTGYLAIHSADGDVIGYGFDEHAAAVREITRLFLEGHSYLEIQRRMNASHYKPPRVGQWAHSTLRTILHNSAYAGYPHWGAVRYEQSQPSGYYPALWDGETYAAILREQQRRATGTFRRKGSGVYAGLVFCARCGGRMHRGINAQFHYYRCANHANWPRGYGQECHANYTDERKITDAIAARLDELNTPEAIDEAMQIWEDEHRQGDLQSGIDGAEKEAAAIQLQRDRLSLAYARGDMDSHQYRRADDTLQREMEGHLARAVESKRLLQAAPDLNLRRETWGHLSREFRLLVVHDDPAVVGKLLQDIGIRVLCEGNEVVSVEP